MLTREDILMIIKNDLCVERIDEIRTTIDGNELKLTDLERMQLK